MPCELYRPPIWVLGGLYNSLKAGLYNSLRGGLYKSLKGGLLWLKVAPAVCRSPRLGGWEVCVEHHICWQAHIPL